MEASSKKVLAIHLAAANTRGQKWRKQVDRAGIEPATHGFSGRARKNISLVWSCVHNIFTAVDGMVLADC